MQWIYNFTQTEREEDWRERFNLNGKRWKLALGLQKREKGEWTTWMKKRNINFQLVFELCSVIRNQKPSCHARDSYALGRWTSSLWHIFPPHSLVCHRELSFFACIQLCCRLDRPIKCQSFASKVQDDKCNDRVDCCVVSDFLWGNFTFMFDDWSSMRMSQALPLSDCVCCVVVFFCHHELFFLY